MILAHYDKNGKILGLYNTAYNYDNIPTPTLEITEDQHREYFAKGQRHVVQKQKDGTLAFVYQEPAAPTADEIKQQKITALDAEYQPQFAALAQSLGLATLDGNQSVVDGIKSDYTALRKDYQIKLEAINND